MRRRRPWRRLCASRAAWAERSSCDGACTDAGEGEGMYFSGVGGERCLRGEGEGEGEGGAGKERGFGRGDAGGVNISGIVQAGLQ